MSDFQTDLYLAKSLNTVFSIKSILITCLAFLCEQNCCLIYSIYTNPKISHAFNGAIPSKYPFSAHPSLILSGFNLPLRSSLKLQDSHHAFIIYLYYFSPCNKSPPSSLAKFNFNTLHCMHMPDEDYHLSTVVMLCWLVMTKDP